MKTIGMTKVKTSKISKLAPPDFSFDDLSAARTELESISLPNFDGLLVIENPLLPPMGVVVNVGSEYHKLLKDQGEDQ